MNKQEPLSLAKEICQRAGKFLREAGEQSRAILQDKERTVQIQADIESEKIIIDFLKEKSRFSIVSEEFGTIEGTDPEYRWGVDPVDGSFNYAYQMPLCCVSLGLWKGEEPILGVIYDFNRDELFAGIVGEGAWCNGTAIQVSQTEEQKKGVVSTGFPAAADFSDEGIKAFVARVQSWRKIRMIGSAALSLACVACGRVDAYQERNIYFWDIAGGIPLVLGAGGKVDFSQTDKALVYDVDAMNGKIK